MKLEIFYHCLLQAHGIDSNHAFSLLADQMAALVDSGLVDAAEKIFIGVNGDEVDRVAVQTLAPKKAVVMAFPHGQSEIPTMDFMSGWVKENPGRFVCYFHMKGASRPNDPLCERWRNRMMQAVVWNWGQCVVDLGWGFDAVGCHWLTPEKWPSLIRSPYFGGNFWWSKSEYLSLLPKLPEDSHKNRYAAEMWIGRRRPYPVIRDYYPGWPA
jgi:hypothetical protein